jgi:hypothetical protein
MTVVNDYTVAEKIRHLRHHIIGIRQASFGFSGGVAAECTILGNPPNRNFVQRKSTISEP